MKTRFPHFVTSGRLLRNIGYKSRQKGGRGMLESGIRVW